MKFLRLAPFDSTTKFRQHIIEPLLTEQPDCGQNLRLLLSSICLRRTNVLLDLPDTIFETVWLDMSMDEATLYSKISEKYRREKDMSISKKAVIKTYNALFQAILQLRLLCDHGTFYQKKNQDFPNQDLNITNDGLSFLQDGSDTICMSCSKEIAVSDTMHRGPSTFMHLLCNECSPLLGDLMNSDDSVPCSICCQADQLTPSAIDLRPQPEDGHSESSFPDPSGSQDLTSSSYHSTKLYAFLKDLEDDEQAAKRYLCQPIVQESDQLLTTDQSLVFSCWTTTLDLLESMLRNRRIKYGRIDGFTSLNERSRIINHFQVDADAAVLLMTTGTGSMGYLTTDEFSMPF